MLNIEWVGGENWHRLCWYPLTMNADPYSTQSSWVGNKTLS